MTTTRLAEWMIDLMPWSWGLKTLVFATLAFIMIRQTTRTSLGRWLIAMFLATTATSAVMTFQTYYLTVIASGADIDSPRLWVIVTGTVVCPLFVSVCGIAIAIYNFRLDRLTGKRDAQRLRHHLGDIQVSQREKP